MAYYGKRSKKSSNSKYRAGSSRRRGSRKRSTSKNRRHYSGNSQRTIRIVVEQVQSNNTRTPDSAYLTSAPVKKKATF